jgi:hypothetical protein
MGKISNRGNCQINKYGGQAHLRQGYGGQAMLILVLVTAMVLSMLMEILVVGLAATDVIKENYQGTNLLRKTEGYLESAALLYLRNPDDYTGESLQEADISCTISVNDADANSKEIICSCNQENRTKKVGLTVTTNQGRYLFSAIMEKT